MVGRTKDLTDAAVGTGEAAMTDAFARFRFEGAVAGAVRQALLLIVVDLLAAPPAPPFSTHTASGDAKSVSGAVRVLAVDWKGNLV